MRNNDDDIKIFRPQRESSAADFTSIAGIMDKQRANGNSTKAVILGERLADFTPEELCPEDASKITPNELMQLRALMVFAAQIAMHKYLPNSILSTQAVNAMFERLEQTSPAFFGSISDGSSFSFYYLAVRKNEDVTNEIGRDYAMLCDEDDNGYLISLAGRVYEETDAKVLSLIENFEFER